MSTILVTGAAGFIGSHLAEALAEGGHRVIGVDDLSGGDANNVPAGVPLVPVDCCDLLQMKSLLSLHRPEVVYHLAASPHEGLSVFAPVHVTRTTYLSTVTLATAAIQAGVRRIVFTSSIARYGDQLTPFTEETPPRPIDPYGVAKVAAENALLALGEAHGIEVVIAVPHNVIGARQRYDDPYRNVVAIMANRCLQGKPPVIYGTGDQVRCLTAVEDVVPALVTMAELSDVNRQVFNLGADEDDNRPIRIKELAQHVKRACQISVADEHLPTRPCDALRAVSDCSKARLWLGYRTRVSLEQAIENVVAWVRAQGPRPFRYHIPIEIDSDRLPVTWKERIL